MKYAELIEARRIPAWVHTMSVKERHGWLEFIHQWLSGQFMGKHNADLLSRWEQFARMFPPRVPPQMRLYRLVTLPIGYAKKSNFMIKPAITPASSWTSTLVGLDSVAGIATDFRGDGNLESTCRLAIAAEIPGDLILATYKSLRDGFMALSHDYFDRYPEQQVTWVEKGVKHSRIDHPGYPGDENIMHMDDVGFLQDVMNRPGGHYRQYEFIVRTPSRVQANVVRIYRIGPKDLRYGNDDPHN